MQKWNSKVVVCNKHVPDWYKTQEMRDKVTPEYRRSLNCLPDCYNDKKMCDKVVHSYYHVLEFILKWNKTQKMCNKAVKTSPSAI